MSHRLDRPQVPPVRLGSRARLIALFAAAVTASALGGACGASFSPPARGEVDFAATRAEPGRPELSGGISIPEGTLHLDGRFALDSHNLIEIGVIDHGLANGAFLSDKHSFLLGSVGLRRRLGDPRDRLQWTLGTGIGAGVGGHADDGAVKRAWGAQKVGMSTEGAHLNPAAAAWLDVGVAWRVSDWFTPYVGGRIQRAFAGRGREPIAPPVTDWAQAGAGARFDVGSLWFGVDAQLVSYTNRLDEDMSVLIGTTWGWRWGARCD